MRNPWIGRERVYTWLDSHKTSPWIVCVLVTDQFFLDSPILRFVFHFFSYSWIQLFLNWTVTYNHDLWFEIVVVIVKQIEKMEKVLRETKGQSLTQDFYQKLTKSFKSVSFLKPCWFVFFFLLTYNGRNGFCFCFKCSYSSGRAGKPLLKWTEVTAFSDSC